MGVGLRVVLIAGAVLLLAFVLNKIRKSQLQTSDAVFWFILGGCLVVLAVFPQIAYGLSNVLGVMSPANLIFLAVVAVLLVKQLMDSVQLARLRTRLAELTQEEALRQQLDGAPGADAPNMMGEHSEG